jgi:hypothetical protein
MIITTINKNEGAKERRSDRTKERRSEGTKERRDERAIGRRNEGIFGWMIGCMDVERSCLPRYFGEIPLMREMVGWMVGWMIEF